MPIVVDAYNVAHVTGVLPPGLAGMDVPELVQVLPRTRFGAESVVLVCDGTPTGGAPRAEGAGRVRVTYAGGGKSADDLIAAMVQRSSAPRTLTVVSSDREVQRAARRRRCPVLSSEDFLRRIASDLHGEFLETLAEAEAETEAGAAGTGAASPPKRPSKPPADPLFPPELIREAAAFELPPEPEPETASDPGPPAAPEAETAPAAAPAASSAPADADADDPLFSADLLAEALELARDDADRRAGDAARRRAEADARQRRDAAGAAEAARLQAEQLARDASARAARELRDRSIADDASSTIDARDLAALDDLLDRAVPVEDRPRKDETFDEAIVAEAERMLREFGQEPRGR